MKKKYKYTDLTYLQSVSDDINFIKKILLALDKEYNELKENLTYSLNEKQEKELKFYLHKAKSSILATIVPSLRKIIIKFEQLAKTETNFQVLKKNLIELTSIGDLAVKEIHEIEQTL